VGRETKPEAADTTDDAPRDFEEVETDCADCRRRQARPGEHRAAEVRQQQQREAVELQPEGIRTKAMTAKAVGVDVERELRAQLVALPLVRVQIDRRRI